MGKGGGKGKSNRKDKKEKKGKHEKREKHEKKNKKNQQDPWNNRKGRKGRGKGKTKQDKNWDTYFKAFNEYLEPKGIYMRDVEGDGNCLFRSIADHIDGEENNHEKYRVMAVDYITKHKDYFAMFLLDDEKIDEYIKDMSEDGTWGGHFELVALSSILNVKFCLHMKDMEPVIVKSSERNAKDMKIVHLAYHIDEHYSSIRKIGDDTKEPAERIPIDISDDEDDDESSSSEDDSTEGSSDKDMSSEAESYYSKDREKKNSQKKNQQEEEYKQRDYGKKQKGKEKEEVGGKKSNKKK